MLKKVDFRFLSISIVSILVGFFTITGAIQSIIPFADPLNEMAFCVLAFTVGLISLMCIKK
tara:strand:- start:53 stop:235 length:183 start_codon:yes stop_codon:yes gene_type:complete